MLAVENRLAAFVARCGNRLCDSLEILFKRDAERDADMIVPRLRNEGDDIRVRVEQRGDAGIVGDRTAFALGHAKGGKARFHRRALFETLGIERIVAAITALYIVDAEFIEQSGDVALV